MPAKEVLLPHASAALFNAPWKYWSVIGKLNFLAQNTRPDISMAVHMCARYVTNHNRIHQDTVKHLCCYLHYTRTRGLILRPSGDNCLNAYVDSDFAGLMTPANSLTLPFLSHRLRHHVLWLPHSQDQQATDWDCPLNYRGGVSSPVHVPSCALLPMRTMVSKLSKGFDFALPLINRQSLLIQGCTSQLSTKTTPVVLNLLTSPTNFAPVRNISVSSGTIFEMPSETEVSWSKRLIPPYSSQTHLPSLYQTPHSKCFASFWWAGNAFHRCIPFFPFPSLFFPYYM
jgi:hypothetical protein